MHAYTGNPINGILANSEDDPDELLQIETFHKTLQFVKMQILTYKLSTQT